MLHIVTICFCVKNLGLQWKNEIQALYRKEKLETFW